MKEDNCILEREAKFRERKKNNKAAANVANPRPRTTVNRSGICENNRKVKSRQLESYGDLVDEERERYI